ncbi:hypothetical protein LTR86_000011 [Recurvomyces mirabilis]|nr:hypothetical protein LTR86_000011 [Recurvomyces mirabilis]
MAGKASNDSPGLLESARRFWQKSYAGDYLGLTLLLTAYILIKFFGEPFHRMFRLDDPRIGFPHAEIERVSVFWLFIYTGAVPLAVLVLWAGLIRPSVHKVHVTILGLLVSIILTCFITDVIKDAVGRPRPDLIARCKPEADTPQHELLTIAVCTEASHHVLHDGWRSFPSGHSSFAFAGLGYLALFFASQAHALRARASLATFIVCLSPLLGAALIAISRLEDYRHDFADVICGSLIGILITYFNWRRYYPSLSSHDCDEPHAQRGSRSGSPAGRKANGFERVRDEEETLATGDRRFSIGDDEESHERSRPR